MNGIEKGIPMPQKAKFYPKLVQMEPPHRRSGQPKSSFVFQESEYSNLRTCIQKVRKHYPNRRFKTMQISATERRIWRVK
jgi:hypothetical protein